MSDKNTSALRRPNAGRGSKTCRATTATAPGPDPAQKRAAHGSNAPARPLPLGPALRIRQAQDLRARIMPQLSGADLEVVITNNRSVMISVNRMPRHHRYQIRLHHMFVDAPEQIVNQLAGYILRNDRRASAELGRYIDENSSKGEVERRVTIRTAGRYHDLSEIFEELKGKYFDGTVDCRITWGRQAARGRARRIVRLGSYTVEQRLIRIHPGLDQEWVPDFFLRWVVFHELLHATLPIKRVNGRRRFHTPELRAGERRFEHYQRAVAWEKANIAALLSI